MASNNIIDLDNMSEDSHLTTLESGDTPTLDDDGESPTIHTLSTAASDAAYGIVNCWTKLDDYFKIIDNTPAHYICGSGHKPLMKWKYFEHTWRDAASWQDATRRYLVTGGEEGFTVNMG